MNCDEARLTIGGEPGVRSPELTEHLRSCPACTRFWNEMAGLEREIVATLDSPPRLPRAAPPRRRAAPVRWALAASLLLALTATGTLWVLWPAKSLAADIVSHVQGEPDSWTSAAHVSEAAVNEILRSSGVALVPGSTDIAYAQSCWFRGHYVPHLVVRTPRGLMTVLVLAHEHVQAREEFEESGFAGTIVPARHGAIAVLARGNAEPDAAAARFEANIRWLQQAR